MLCDAHSHATAALAYISERTSVPMILQQRVPSRMEGVQGWRWRSAGKCYFQFAVSVLDVRLSQKYVRMYADICIHACMYVCMLVSLYTIRIDVYTYVCMLLCMYVCIYVYVCVRVCLYMSNTDESKQTELLN